MQPKIILVETSHPGNIGATARAMKTMSLHELGLVNPQVFPDPVAFARASGAADILDQAYEYSDLTAAIADCQKVVGITARSRRISAPVVTPKQLMHQIVEQSGMQKVAWVFGRERNGLTNDEIDLCDTICTIPSNQDYGSLNLAAAVQILSYEWFVAQLAKDVQKSEINTQLPSEPAAASEKEGFYSHLWEALEKIDFIDRDNPTPLMRKLRRLYDRANLTSAEINILRGILKNIIKQ